MIETPRLVTTPHLLVARIPVVCPRDAIREVMGPGIQEVIAAVVAQGVGPAGPWLCHHHEMRPDVFDFDICVPVRAPVTPVGRVLPGELAARRAAETVMHGGYEELFSAWPELMAWMAAEHLEPAPDLLEIYTVGPNDRPSPADWRTTLVRPLR